MKTIEWIILVSSNYERSKTFYRDTLELPLVREIAREEFAQFKLEHTFLAIYGKKFVEELLGASNVLKGTPGGGAIYTFNETDNINALYKNLVKKGVQFIKSPITQPWGQRTAYFTDPDGHVWEIQQWIKKPKEMI